MKRFMIILATIIALLLQMSPPVSAEETLIQPYPPKTVEAYCAGCHYSGEATVDKW